MLKIKILTTLIFIFIAAIGFAEEAKPAWQPELRIGVMFNQKNATIMANRDCIFFAGKEKTRIFKGEVLAVILTNDGIEIKGKKFGGNMWEIRTDDPREIKTLVLRVNGKSYRGGLRFLRKGDSMTIINVTPAEEYLRGVVPEEMPPLWSKEALKAQTVAARTFALKNRKRHEAEGFDLCTGVHCQVYAGQVREHTNSDTAIKETYGEVLFALPSGPIIDTPFHTDSGGMTENNEELWGRGIPYLRGVKELKEKTNPWTKTVSRLDFEKKAKINNIKKIELSPLTIGKRYADRTKSGRVKNIRIVGEKETKFLTGAELRSLFNLNSTLFDVTLKGKTVEFKGYGIGHGVGMSQYGAKAWAESGKNYKEILEHYYRKTFIKKLY